MDMIPKKAIFIGEKFNCEQVAYVLNYTNYLWLPKFNKTIQNTTDPIYICESRKNNKFKKKYPNLNFFYLEDICDIIDAEYAKHHPLSNRIFNLTNKHHHFKSKFFHQKLPDAARFNLIRKMRPSELFLYVMTAKPKKNFICDLIENKCHIEDNGAIRCGCCSVVIPVGSLLTDSNPNEIYNGIYARIIKLSALNRSYCLCDFNRWCHGYDPSFISKPKPMITPPHPKMLSIAIDTSCNLKCRSCRQKHYINSAKDHQNLKIMTNKLLESKWLQKAKWLELAGVGEVFYSPYYRRLLFTDINRKKIRILSNGILLNRQNWEMLQQHYEDIEVSISVDAATTTTYQKLRGSNFNLLLQNLQMLGEARQKNTLHYFELNFVVQRDNYLEMIDFVKLAKSLHVDHVLFQALSNFTQTNETLYRQNCLIINNEYLDADLYRVLQDPIFKDPIVDLGGFTRYLVNSQKYY